MTEGLELVEIYGRGIGRYCWASDSDCRASLSQIVLKMFHGPEVF